MKKITVSCSVIAVMLFVSINQSLAQKIFEGYWQQTTLTNSPLIPTEKNQKTEQQVFYKKGKMKFVDQTKGTIMIMRLDKELSWTIDKAEGTYSEMKFEEMQESMKNARQEMQEGLKNMSPEERQMMEKMLGKKMSGMFGEDGAMKIDVKKTNEKKTINGYSCQKAIYLMNNEPLLDFWLTDKYQLGSEFLEAYEKMGILKGDFSDVQKNFQGFPIQSEMSLDTGMGKTETVTTVTKIVEQSVADSEFELPKGLKKVEHLGMQ